MPTSHFHPLVRAWFERRFGEPTPAQAEGWPAIASGRHTLIAAPTGSGKTLAAFLTSLDVLVRQALEPSAEDPSQPQGLPDSIQIVYVSPLKALANDIKRNLLDPLAEITALAEERGTPLPEIRVAVRTGDTSAKERALHAKRPPHVLITTPESLFILLTSERGRHALASVHTLILDELHAVVPNKRGSHLALSVERLCRLADGPVTRIGLSATQKPIETVARFLTGAGDEAPDPGCAIVDTGHKRDMDLAVVLPDGFELGPIATHEQWAQVLDQITELVDEHRTTLVFVNTRRLAERVAHLLSERIGEENVAAHHGSLSMEVRFDAEQRLKAGAVKVCVATASLELGIDVGVVDLVCLIGSPRSIGVALQRIGRSGHWLGGTPKGRLFPLTRDELVETAALLRAIGAGALDALAVPPWPLDVLAQQIVAACVTEEWAEDDLFAFVRTAYPYRELPRERFDDVVRMLSEGVANRWGRGSAYLHRDGVHHTLKARRGARLAAITSGGTIPDTADYLVIAEPDGTVVGAVNEDFAIESMAGDIFLLGNTPWKIRRIESGSVRVEEAHGQSPTIPFWTGEAPGRTVELSAEVSALRQGVDERLALPEEAVAWVMEGGASRDAAEQIVAYIAEGKRVLGLVPTGERLIAERFFDEAGGMQLVIHSPLGSRINRAWGLALRKRFCVGFNYELQASATDEGINIALGPQHSFPVADVFGYVKSPTARDVLLQAVLQAPVFGTRWRWTASRSLTLLRRSGGKRVPTPIQRMRADDLLAAVFPAAAACQDNMAPGAPIELPDHPLVFETVRDCLTEALDVEGFTALLGRIERHEIEVYGKDTLQPSVFSHQILNAMPYAFLDDAPLEERRARAVALRRALPENAQDLGSLDPNAIAQEQENAWPPVRDVDETHDALLSLGVLCEADIAEHADDPAQWRMWLDDLAADGRVQTLEAGGRTFWLATERAEGVRAAYGGVSIDLRSRHSEEPDGRREISHEALAREIPRSARNDSAPGAEGHQEAIVELVRGRVESTGPFTVDELAERLALDVGAVRQAAAQLEAEGVVLRGAFRPGAAGDEFCDRRILARIHRSTIGRLRRAVEPVPAASLLRFLLEWQHATPGSRLSGDAGLVEVVEQLQGFEAAAAAWEGAVLTNRLTDFHPSTLDALCFGGELAWGRLARRTGDPPSARLSRTRLSRNGPVSIALREDLPWLLDPPSEDAEALTGPAAEVLDYLSTHGASFAPDIVAGTRQLPSQVEEALWVLVAAGRVTADGFSALRGLVSGLTKKVQRRSRFATRMRVRGTAGRAGSRWSLLRAAEPDPADDLVEARAAQLLRRYGVVTRELLTREPMAPPWWKLVRAYRRAEARGEVRGGRFVAGFVGEQFALPEAVDALRAVHRRERTGEVVRLSACDPLNLVGILTPGPRIPAVVGNEVLYRDGVPIEAPSEAVASA